MKWILRIVKLLIVALLIFSVMFSYNFLIKKQELKNKSLKIEKGETVIDIYRKLSLNYGIFDKIYFKVSNSDEKIKQAYYEFDKNISKYEMILTIINSINNEIVLTIPEGFTSKQVLERIEKLGLAKKEDMLAEMKNYDFYYKHDENFEGYLFPETYFINKGASPKEILDTILGEFIDKFPVEQYDKNKMYDIVILASIIEKEVNKEEDRKKVSAVFHNRLAINMLLQSDATLKYSLDRAVTKKDLLESNSKYNTYKYKGLTPTPISNPRLENIHAAMNPEKNFKELYFFMYKGKTYYSKTHEEHLKKRKESGHIK